MAMDMSRDRRAVVRRHISIIEAQVAALQTKAAARGLNWADVEVAMGLLAMAEDYRAELERLEQPGLSLVPVAADLSIRRRVMRSIPA